MKIKKEKIEVTHCTPDKIDTDTNEKSLCFEYNGYTVLVDISGEGNYKSGVFIEIRHNDCHGFVVNAKIKNKEMILSLDQEGFRKQTGYRNYIEWIKLENIEKSVKLIGSLFKS